MSQGTPRIKADASAETRPRDRASREQRLPCHKPTARIDADLAHPLASFDRQLESSRRNDALHQRLVDADGPRDLPSRHDRDRALPIPDARLEIDMTGRQKPDGTVTRDAPPEQRGQVCVAPRTCRASEHGRIQRDTVAADSGDLTPARAARVPGLDAVEP